MPPHCDSMDGPVVTAAVRALGERNVDLVLPYVHQDGEQEVREAFQKVLPLHEDGPMSREVAERVRQLEDHAHAGIREAREYVEAALGLQVWSHKLAQCARANPHGESEETH
jgi:fructosamine-3-kinase